MCGLWGFNNQGKLDLDTVARIIEAADERGGHAYGVFGIRKNGQHFTYKSSGRSNTRLLLALIGDAKLVIGHSRLATSGDLSLLNAQPIITPGGVLVHNGNVEGHTEIMQRLNYQPFTRNDSEAIAPMILNSEAYNHLVGAFLFIRIKDLKAELITYKNRLPLVEAEINGVTYYCSKEWRRY
jgi:glucosamine 6-phosphate synthetase-like amidotransferase/phosphosugar isomerase protein